MNKALYTHNRGSRENRKSNTLRSGTTFMVAFHLTEKNKIIKR